MHQTIRARFARARGQAGAFDLPSIITGVVVVGILTAGVLAAIFGVIPWAQDNAARQDLDSVRTAQGVSIAKDGSYEDAAGLESKSYLKSPGTLKIGTNAEKNCFVAVSRSASGNVFFNSSSNPNPQPYTAGVSTDPCTSVGDLVTQLPAPGGTPSETPGSDLPVPPGALLVTPTVAANMDGIHTISGYGTVPDSSVLTSWGVEVDTTAGAETWVEAGEGTSFTLSYYDKSTREYVDYYAHDMSPERFAIIVQRGPMVFASVVDYTPDLTAEEIAGFGKMLADGGKLTFLPDNGNGTTKATVIMGPASVTTTDPDGPASDYEESPSWKPLLALVEPCYGNPDTTHTGAFWMDKDNIPAAASDISVRSQVFNYGAKDVYRSGVDDINASVPACTYSADIVLDNPTAMYSMLQDPRPWQPVGEAAEWSMDPGTTSTWQELALPADNGTQVKLSYYDPATGGFQQFYSAVAGDGDNGTANLKASYSETVTRSSDGGWLSTDRDPMHVALEFSPGTTEYADLYRVMSTYGGSIEFTAAGKTVTVNVGPEANYYTMDPFAPAGGGGGDAT